MKTIKIYCPLCLKLSEIMLLVLSQDGLIISTLKEAHQGPLLPPYSSANRKC